MCCSQQHKAPMQTAGSSLPWLPSERPPGLSSCQWTRGFQVFSCSSLLFTSTSVVEGKLSIRYNVAWKQLKTQHFYYRNISTYFKTFYCYVPDKLSVFIQRKWTLLVFQHAGTEHSTLWWSSCKPCLTNSMFFIVCFYEVPPSPGLGKKKRKRHLTPGKIKALGVCRSDGHGVVTESLFLMILPCSPNINCHRSNLSASGSVVFPHYDLPI